MIWDVGATQLSDRVTYHPWYEKFQNGKEIERPALRILLRIAANHFSLRAHLNRMDILDDANCLACGGWETIDHVLFLCPGYQRIQLTNEISCLGITAPFHIRDIVASRSEREIPKELYNFCTVNNIKL